MDSLEVWGISGGPVNLNDDDDMLLGSHSELPDPRSSPSKGFCFRYSKLLAKYPLLVFFVLIILTGACGATAFFAYERPDFGDPTKGFEARGVELTERMVAGRHVSSDYRLRKYPIFPELSYLIPEEPGDTQELSQADSSYESPGQLPDQAQPTENKPPTKPDTAPTDYESSASYSSSDDSPNDTLVEQSETNRIIEPTEANVPIVVPDSEDERQTKEVLPDHKFCLYSETTKLLR